MNGEDRCSVVRRRPEHDPAVESKLYSKMDQLVRLIDEMPNKELNDLRTDHAKQAKWRRLVRAIMETQENSDVTLIDASESISA